MKITIEFCIFKLDFLQNFSLNLRFWFFGPNFAKKGYFQSKTDKMNTTNKIYIFELVYVPNFSLNWKLRFSEANFSKKV